MVKSLVNILKYACWRIKTYRNRIKVYKISQTQIFIPLILFLVKKRVQKEYDVDEYLSLVWDFVNLCQVALFTTHKRFIFCVIMKQHWSNEKDTLKHIYDISPPFIAKVNTDLKQVDGKKVIKTKF